LFVSQSEIDRGQGCHLAPAMTKRHERRKIVKDGRRQLAERLFETAERDRRLRVNGGKARQIWAHLSSPENRGTWRWSYIRANVCALAPGDVPVRVNLPERPRESAPRLVGFVPYRRVSRA